MEITQKQRIKIAQKQKTNPHIQDYCADYLYATHISEQQYNNLMFIHDEPAEVLRRTFFVNDIKYTMPNDAVMWSKTIQHGWSHSPWAGKKQKLDK